MKSSIITFFPYSLFLQHRKWVLNPKPQLSQRKIANKSQEQQKRSPKMLACFPEFSRTFLKSLHTCTNRLLACMEVMLTNSLRFTFDWHAEKKWNKNLVCVNISWNLHAFTIFVFKYKFHFDHTWYYSRYTLKKCITYRRTYCL